MLKTITQLVPFGQDSLSENICGYYLANLGWDQRLPMTYSYLIGFYEVASEFNNYIQTEKFLLITGWDRNKSNFELLQEIFKEQHHWSSYTSVRKIDQPLALQMRVRALKDKLFIG